MKPKTENKEDLEKGKIDEDTFTCSICYCDYDTKETPIKMLKGCGHTFCKECFSEFYRSLIEDQNKDHKLSCPEYDCEVKP